MAKINFEKFPLFMDIAHKQLVVSDVKQELCDIIYSRGTGIAYHALALKIYNTPGEVELDDKEIKLLTDFGQVMFSPNMIDSLKELLQSQQS